MKYYTIVIREDSQSIYQYDSRDHAIAKFHEELTYGYNAKIGTTALVIDHFGHYVKSPEVYSQIEE